MIRGIYHSAAGMVPRYFRLVNISNNLANAPVNGYKTDRRYFSTVLNNEIVQPGQGGKPKRLADLEEGFYTEFDQGSMENHRTPTFFALHGEGFFCVENPESGDKYYTRNGRFRLNNENELVNSSGYTVLDETDTPVVITDSRFTVDEFGEIYVDGQNRGKLKVVSFTDPNMLIKKGASLFSKPEELREIEPEETKVLQGHLESSNVNVVREMVMLIELNRNYESSQKALVAQDSSLDKAVNQVSKF